jgi:8-hydroxy-5-deazaflavin:NADPH oxidoreductase
VRAGTVVEAARFGDRVAVAIPVHAIRRLPPQPFAGKIVVDANNYYPEPGGHVPALDADETTSAQLLASLLPGGTVVVRLLEESRPDLPDDDRLAIPVGGDDPDAQQTVIELIEQIRFTGFDAGALAPSRRQQPGSPLYLPFADSRRR